MNNKTWLKSQLLLFKPKTFIMNFYLQAFKRYADFSGRSRRSEYWYFVLFNFLMSILTLCVDFISGIPIFTLLYLLASFIPAFALIARRLHDIGKSAWWYFIVLVPVAGIIVLFVFLITDSQPGRNQWGEDPKLFSAMDLVG